ncbi:MAG: stage II sporulation protein M [Anaerolineae bacterium]|nr:stage II sporulation protein M [Anaerolineae bacterium]
MMRYLYMQYQQLVQQRRLGWERLENYLRRIERDQIKSLSQAELVEFGQLYRSTTSDLAIAQRDFPRHDVTAYLNQLVGRAHPVVYRGEPLVLKRLVNFYLRDLPRLYRETLPFIGAAALLLFGPAVIAYVVMVHNPAAATLVLDPATIGMIESGDQWWKELNERNQVGSAFLMTHNLGIAFLAFAGGMVLGLVTLYVLVLNGINIGSVLGLLHAYGNAGPLWEFIAGHGVLELSEITIAGGCGLMLGYAMLRPGLLSRRDAVGIATQKSVRLLLGTAPILVIAGIIEGMISPQDVLPAFVKFGVAIITGLLLYGYLLLTARSRQEDEMRTRA